MYDNRKRDSDVNKLFLSFSGSAFVEGICMLVAINSAFTFKMKRKKLAMCSMLSADCWKLTRHLSRASADRRWSLKWASTSTGCPNTFYLMLRNHLDGRDRPNHPAKRWRVNICSGKLFSSHPDEIYGSRHTIIHMNLYSWLAVFLHFIRRPNQIRPRTDMTNSKCNYLKALSFR